MHRILLVCLFSLIVSAPTGWSADAAPHVADASTLDEATRIASEIIQQRARDCEAAGKAGMAAQLNALAKGLTSGRVTLYDASLVMQIAVIDAPPRSAGTTGATPAQAVVDAKTSARQATALLDGVSPADLKPAAEPTPPLPGPPPATIASASSTGAANTAGVESAKPKPLSTKVYAVDLGSDGRMSRAILGVGTKHGVIVGTRFIIRRNNVLVATVSVMLVKDALSYCQLVPGTLADPRDDVKEGDQAVIAPTTADAPTGDASKAK